MKKTVYPSESPINYKQLVKTGLKKVTLSSDFYICIPDYTQTPDVYLENISCFARKDAYRVGDKVVFKTLDEFLGYIGANEPTTYYFISISKKVIQSDKNELLVVDRLLPYQDKDVVIYTDNGALRAAKIRVEADMVIIPDSMQRFSPEKFQKELIWGVVSGIILP